jgi:hypothetical protein
MICIHFYEQFGIFDYKNTLPDSLFRNLIEFTGGPLAAPFFMFSMGIGMIYTGRNRPEDFIRRGGRLLLTGYALNFFRQTLPQLAGMALGIDTDIDLTGGDYLLSMSCTGYEKGNLTAYHRCYDLVSVTVISDKYNVGFYDMNSKTTVRKL